MKTKLLFLVAASMLFSIAAEAKLAGKNVVLVHGFRSQDLANPPSVAEQKNNAQQYWAAFWNQRAEASLYWSSADRVTGRIKDSIRTQIKQLEANRTCAAGCVFVTHSTGDLVLRDALTRLGQWGVNSNNFRVLTVIDLAGAGGGTEIANVADGIANGSGVFNSIARSAINTFLGFTPAPGNLGVLLDLRPATARSIAQQNNAYPRLRVVGAGDQFLRVTKPFVLGHDDSVVPLHSACGTRSAGDVRSCDANIRTNGQLARVRYAPGPLMHNHFPIVMADSADHEEMRNNNRSGGAMTTVVNNRSFNGINVDFATNTSRRSWSWFTRVREINDSSRKSVSAVVFDTLNR